jgi:hypothetical protein
MTALRKVSCCLAQAEEFVCIFFRALAVTSLVVFRIDLPNWEDKQC